MKKRIFKLHSLLLILLAFTTALLTGCSSGPITVSANSGFSTATRLALGTLKLEGTSQAVIASQASELLTLWEAYASLSNSDTVSQVELNGLVKQIESTMTSDQIKAIDAMDLNNQSVSEVLSTLGGSGNTGTPVSTPSASGLNQNGSSGGTGGIPTGGSGAIPSVGPSGAPPGGDGSGVGDILSGVSVQSTPAAKQSTASTGAMQVNPMLLQAVIQLLETRSQASG